MRTKRPQCAFCRAVITGPVVFASGRMFDTPVCLELFVQEATFQRLERAVRVGRSRLKARILTLVDAGYASDERERRRVRRLLHGLL